MRNAACLLALSLAASPALLFAQKREDLLEIQRDVAQLEDQVNQLQKSQDEKMAALTMLVQQALDASNKASASAAALQKNIGESLSDQQRKVAEPVAVLQTRMDGVSQDLGAVRENIADLSRRLATLDSKLTDIGTAVRTLSAPPAAPPPNPGAALTGPASGTAPGAAPGVSAETLWENARRDDTSGKGDLAMSEYLQYIKTFPDLSNAPKAQFYIGQLYDRAKQYEDAADAFDAVVERFPKNEKTCDAMYMKGVELMKAKNRRTDAASAFKDYVKACPGDDNISNAKSHLRTLGMSTSSSRKRK